MTRNLSAKELARAYAAAKSAATRKELRDLCASRANTSARARWKHLLAAIDSGDKARIAYHAAEGREARAEAAAKIERPAKAPAKAPAKPAAKAAKAPKAPAKAPKADAGAALAALDALAAFIRAL
jgi:hypothetical protein